MPNQRDIADAAGQGCGPLLSLAPLPGKGLRQQVLEHLRAAGSLPRVDLARSLGISPATVTAITAELIDAGLIVEVEDAPRREADNTRGRPPVALGLKPEALHVAGIKLSDQVHTAVILDFAGNRIADVVLPSSAATQSLDETINAAEAVLLRVLRHSGLSMKQLAAVAVGLPGFVDHQSGIVAWSPLVSKRNVPLRAALEARINRPVLIDNDANLVTLAELWFGKGRSLPDFAVVTIEHGVGMGLVINHQLYRGALGLGMELGHTKVQLDGALCRCGQRGCLEAYVADYALVREASTALNWGHRSLSSPHVLLESCYDHAKAGNEAAKAIFHRAGRYLALGLANVITFFDPTVVLLSGERMRYDFLYAEEVLTEMSNLTLQTGRLAPRVEIHAWGDLLWAQGAAALALDHATNHALMAEFVT